MHDAPARQSAGSADPSAWRALLQPLPLVGVVLVVFSFVGYLSVYRETTKRTAVLVAARALPAGTVVSLSDLRAGEIAGDAGVLGVLLPERALAGLVGRRLASALAAGSPLTAADFARVSSAASALTLAVPLLHALAGALQPGDRVSVLATYDLGNGVVRSVLVAHGVEVLSVGNAPDALDPSQALIPVTVALPDRSLASRLALANEAAKIDLLRDGATAAQPIPPAQIGQPA